MEKSVDKDSCFGQSVPKYDKNEGRKVRGYKKMIIFVDDNTEGCHGVCSKVDSILVPT